MTRDSFRKRVKQERRIAAMVATVRHRRGEPVHSLWLMFVVPASGLVFICALIALGWRR